MPQIGVHSEDIEESPAIYLFPSFEALNEALSGWFGELWDEDDELMICVCDLPDGFLVPDKDSNGDIFYETVCDKRIPPKYISYYNEIGDKLCEKVEESFEKNGF